MVKHFLRESIELVQLIFTNSECENDESLSQVLQDNDYVNTQDKLKRTPLHAAAYKNSVNFTQHLLGRGARINSKDINWLTPLHIAAYHGSVDVVKVLLSNGADRFSRDIQWKMPLHLACSNRKIEIVKVLLSESFDLTESSKKVKMKNINSSDKNGRTPLHHAVHSGCIEIVKYLVENQASVNALDKEDRRPLHWASGLDNEELISYLLDNEAEINCRDKKLFTPLHVAVSCGNISAVKVLLTRGADTNALTLQGNTIFHLVCLNGHLEVLKILMENCNKSMLGDKKEIETLINVMNTTNFLGQNPIHIACSSEKGFLCLDYVLKHFQTKISPDVDMENFSFGLDIQTTRDGFTPLHLAAYFGRFEAAEILLKNNVDLNSQDYYGNRPLHVACIKGRDRFVQFLLNSGARWDSLDLLGDSPLHVAAMSGNHICLGRLLKAASDEFAIDRFSTASSTSNTDDEEFLVTPDGKVTNERPDCGDYLLKKHLKKIVNMIDSKGRNLIHASVLGLNMECLKIALIHGGDLNLKDYEKRTPLHLCSITCVLSSEFLANINSTLLGELEIDFSAKRQHEISQASNNPNATSLAFDMAKVLLKLGADINQMDKFGLTALHFASAMDYSGELVSLLKTNNANLLVPALWSTTRMDLVNDDSSKESSEIEDYSDEKKFKNRIGEGFEYFYPIHFAAVTGNHVAIEILLESMTPDIIYSVIVNAIHIVNPSTFFRENAHLLDNKKVTSNVLFIACQKGHLQTLESLINITDHALKLLTTKDEYSDLYEHLSQRSIGSVTDSLGRTLLHVAASAGNLEICRYLLENSVNFGVDICAKDEIFRWNALHHAASQGHVPVVNLLLKWHNRLLLLRNEKNSNLDPDASPQNQTLFINSNAPMEDFKTNCSEGNLNIQTVTSPFLVDVGDEHLRTPLILAAQNNHTGTIELLLAPRAMGAQDKNQIYANIPVQKWIELRANAVDVYLRSALHRTVVNGHLDCFSTLLKRGANIHARDFRDRHSLHMIATIGNLTMLSRLTQTIQKIISQITDSDLSLSDPYLLDQVHPLDHTGFSPLHYAILKSNLDCVKFLISLPEYNSASRGSDFTIIHCASQTGNPYCLEECLKVQFIPKIFYAKEMSSFTALHLACLNNNFRCVTHLLKFEETMSKLVRDDEDSRNLDEFLIGKLASITDSLGRTPLMISAMSGSTSCLEKLLNFHQRINILQTMQPKNSTDSGLSFNSGIICLSKNLGLDTTDENGMTLLHHACTHNLDYAGLLILEKMENNDIINKRDHKNRTPAHLAIQSGLPNLLDALIQRGANLYAVDQQGRIPALSSTQNPKIAECLSLCLAAMFPSIQTTKKTPLTSPKREITSRDELQINWSEKQHEEGIISPLGPSDQFELTITKETEKEALNISSSPVKIISSDPDSGEDEFF